MLIVVIDSYRYNEIETDPWHVLSKRETHILSLSLSFLLIPPSTLFMLCITVHKRCNLRLQMVLDVIRNELEKNFETIRSSSSFFLLSPLSSQFLRTIVISSSIFYKKPCVVFDTRLHVLFCMLCK